MAKWEYTLTNGKALHNAISKCNIELVVECLLECYKELYAKLTDEDKEWRGFDIEDAIETLTYFDADEAEDDDVDYYLDDFYNLCDELRAWITL
jgi:hypothetical protein